MESPVVGRSEFELMWKSSAVLVTDFLVGMKAKTCVMKTECKGLNHGVEHKNWALLWQILWMNLEQTMLMMAIGICFRRH